MSKYLFVLSTSIAALAGIWTWLAFTTPTLGTIPFVLWPTFIGWAAFYYAGATVEGMIKGTVQLVTGAVLSWIMMMAFVAGNFPAASAPAVLGAVVFVIAWLLTAATGMNKWWALAPAGFSGAASYFGVGSAVSAAQAHTSVHIMATLFPLVAGELLGWVSAALAAPALPGKSPAAQTVHA